MNRFLCFLLALLTAWAVAAPPAAEAATYRIAAVKIEQRGEQFQVRVQGDAPPTYTMYELFEPLRLVIDIADAALAPEALPVTGLPKGPIRELKGSLLSGRKPPVARLEMVLSEDRGYSVERQKHDIVVVFKRAAKISAAPSVTLAPPEPAGAAALIAELAAQPAPAPDHQPAITAFLGSGERIQPLIPPPAPIKASVVTAAPETPAPAKATAPAPKSAAQTTTAPADTFGFAGYEKQKISVDFFKIDLHNVFRLFGEIGGQNIVVDEAVKGNLTLALQGVPWDFALDIILNLKDLQKEERFNTIVISPKAKNFVWPKTVNDSLAFKADGSMEKVEAISVRQRLETPREVLEAKEIIRQAGALDKRGEYEAALARYEEAFGKWPDNGGLAQRMATICLARLGLNAKAAHYAKAALALEPDNGEAALLAAIALANMKQVEEAKGYFDRAIAGPRPTAEAFLNYAAFAEEYESYHGALALLGRHTRLYGDTLDTLVGRARLYDKLGDAVKAVAEYRGLLFSGYQLPDDLHRYAQGRVTAAGE